MAGDWIKIQNTLPDKPEVGQLSSRLKIDQDSVVGKLIRLWIWADENSINGNAIPVTYAFLDRLVDKRGFAKALFDVKWLIGEEENLSLVNFDRHNGKTAKERALTNDRVAKTRKSPKTSNGDVHGASVTQTEQKPLPEKRREDKEPISVDTPVPKSPAALLCITLRARGVECGPGHPEIIALTQQGITVETVEAAIDEAKRAKGPEQRITLGYIVGILKNWKQRAETTDVTGAVNPETGELKQWFETMSGWIAKGAELGETFDPDNPRDPFPKYKARIAAKLGDGPWSTRL